VDDVNTATILLTGAAGSKIAARAGVRNIAVAANELGANSCPVKPVVFEEFSTRMQ